MLICLLGWGSDAGARQQFFERTTTDTGFGFHYQWVDRNNAMQSVRFTLAREALADVPLQQTAYRPAIAQRYVYVEMLKSAREIDPRVARVNLSQRGNDIQMAVVAGNNNQITQVKQQLTRARELAFDEYLDEHYFTEYRTPMNQPAIKPDHVRYVSENTMALIPLSQAFYEKVDQQSDARNYMNLMLGWLQSIPYDTLEDRADSHGAGFSPPFTLLSQNLGDCDSKAVLAASIVRAFLPSTPMVLVLLDQHALLGLAIAPVAGDTTLKHNNRDFVLFDPTGPAQLPFGQVSPDTVMAVRNQRYVLEAIQ
ncbi:hypothetical protein OCL06_00240 [Alteromonas sp. ASW11-19]|uniref:Transglutaminase domain-containing protein n=1 Tax=Alteromonas salexigens TaxID=2982530 RepID=A0ABT2VKP1_9ALTE|nr:hypothetical protein [Alteromonas salexigens]MCU7553018.1 hypothetical protein [Alteromonas salexigens]